MLRLYSALSNVLTPDVRLEGFTTSDWVRLGEVLRPRDDRPRERDEPIAQLSAATRRGAIVAVTTGARLRKLLSTRKGRIDPTSEAWPSPLHDLAARHEARWAIQIETGALEALMDRFADRLRREHELTHQALELVAALRELESEGALKAWPMKLEQWPVPSERMLMRALDLFCPDGENLLIGVFERGEVATCLAARRRGSGFDWIVGPDELRTEMGLTSGDWTRDYRHLGRAVERRMGPLALGCYGEMDTFRRLAERPTPGAWAAAVAARDIILSPLVPAVAIPLGIDAGRAAFAAMRGLAERLGASSLWERTEKLYPALERVRDVATGEKSIESLLGFDPMALLRKLQGRDG